MKLYKINGNLYTWEQAHNLGYTTTPTEEVTFYSASDSDWGAEVTGGFLDKHSSQAFLDWEYWVSEEQEWNDPNNLMQWAVYPSGGEDIVLTNGSITSDAVRIVDDAGTAWYIVRKAMELGWVDEEELEENGWQPYVGADYEFILFNTETGKISSGIERLNETVFAEALHFTIDDETEIVFVQQSQFPPIVTEQFSTQQTVADGSVYETGLPYYASKLYLHEVYTNDWEWEDWSVSESATHTVSIVNGTGASATVSDAILRYINAANAEVVTVKETLSSYKYQAFKYTLSGTDYYWVNDRTHDTWTDDLSAWGYEVVPAVVLPTVSSDMWAAAKDADRGRLASQASIQAYDENNNAIAYDDSISYGVIEWKKYSPFNAFGGRTETALIKYTDIYSNSLVYIKNVSQSMINFFQLRYKTCSDSTAIVVSVYDSSNVAYNSFKFTTNGIDYYYVLDGTQTDWTDDLSSIGYSLTPTA